MLVLLVEPSDLKFLSGGLGPDWLLFKKNCFVFLRKSFKSSIWLGCFCFQFLKTGTKIYCVEQVLGNTNMIFSVDFKDK